MDLVAKHKELDEHLKEQYKALEKTLMDMNIQANFDPSVKDELEWAASQIHKVLAAVPELETLEKKLGMVKNAESEINKVHDDLSKIVDFSKMILPKDVEKAKENKKDSEDKQEKKEEKKDDKKEEKKDEEKKDEKKGDEKKIEKKEDKKEEKKDEKKDEKKTAAQLHSNIKK